MKTIILILFPFLFLFNFKKVEKDEPIVIRKIVYHRMTMCDSG